MIAEPRPRLTWWQRLQVNAIVVLVTIEYHIETLLNRRNRP